MEKFDVVVVGAGLAGLSTAYCLAKEGMEVLVVERGDYPGAKNVTGGRIYLNPIKQFFPDILSEAPFERLVTKEIFTLIGVDSSTTVKWQTHRSSPEYHPSFTVLRAKFDRWFADRVQEQGAIIISKKRVDELIKDNGKIVGIVVEDDRIQADVVVAADGVNSLIAEKAGMRKKLPQDFALGIKEVIELSPQIIESRFNLKNDEGAAQLFLGVTYGMFGGGFLYTNKDSLSLGVVVRIKDLMEKKVEAHKLMEKIKEHAEISVLIEGGDTVEYSAHVVPEEGATFMPRLYGEGILVVGDAAFLSLNMGITIRGMDFAMASGALASEAIKLAKERNDFSSQSLSVYEKLLKGSFVLKDLDTFRQAHLFLDSPRIYQFYPNFICNLLEKLLYIGEDPKEKLSTTVFKAVLNQLGFSPIKDIVRFMKI